MVFPSKKSWYILGWLYRSESRVCATEVGLIRHLGNKAAIESVLEIRQAVDCESDKEGSRRPIGSAEDPGGVIVSTLDLYKAYL